MLLAYSKHDVMSFIPTDTHIQLLKSIHLGRYYPGSKTAFTISYALPLELVDLIQCQCISAICLSYKSFSAIIILFHGLIAAYVTRDENNGLSA